MVSSQSSTISHGLLTQQLLSGANRRGADGFPGPQVWADDVEQVLTFLKRENRLPIFLSVIQKAKNPQHRDAQLAEARSGFFFSKNGFQILEWEPIGEGNKTGDILVSFGESISIFVEVKQPSWRFELMPMQCSEKNRLPKNEKLRRYERAKQNKFLPGVCEGRSVDPRAVVMDVVRRNALKKLTDRCPNLAMSVDDCNISAVGFPGLAEYVAQEFIYPNHDPDDPEDVFTYERLGGVLFLRPEAEGTGNVEYKVDFVENPLALPKCAIPREVSTLFQSYLRKLKRKKENDMPMSQHS